MKTVFAKRMYAANVAQVNALIYCRYELIDILRTNNFNTSHVRNSELTITNKRAKLTERRILKGFNISTVDTLQAAFAETKENSSKDFFKVSFDNITWFTVKWDKNINRGPTVFLLKQYTVHSYIEPLSHA